jgi:PTH1 family peptidyl-tRNA hydrolase
MPASSQSATTLRLIAGLGNPGIEYAFTPHNFGFLLVDELAGRGAARVSLRECQAITGRATIAGARVLLAKPETFMNLSGIAVRELLLKHDCNPAECLVACDDLDLPLGTLRIRERGSAGTHNGLRSVVGALGTTDFPRIRLGVGPGRPVDALEYVLRPWKKSELRLVQEVLERAADAVEMIFREGMKKAMSLYNAAPQASGA